MAVAATPHARQNRVYASESTFSNVIDRWIYVFMAVLFIAITFTGFVPDSLGKIASRRGGRETTVPARVAHSRHVDGFVSAIAPGANDPGGDGTIEVPPASGCRSGHDSASPCRRRLCSGSYYVPPNLEWYAGRSSRSSGRHARAST